MPKSNWLGLNLPTSPEPTSEQLQMREVKSRASNEKWRNENPKKSKLLDFFKGATGLGDTQLDNPNASKWDKVPGALGELMTAGVPFSALGLKHLYHGAAANIKKFNYDKTGDLSRYGRGIYLADDPEKAGKYAIKRGMENSVGDEPVGSVVYPIKPDAKNILDFTEIDPADYDKIYGAGKYEVDKPYITGENLQDFNNSISINDKKLKEHGFDGVKYKLGTGANAYFFPESVPLHTSYGNLPFNDAALNKPIKVKQSAKERALEGFSKNLEPTSADLESLGKQVKAAEPDRLQASLNRRQTKLRNYNSPPGSRNDLALQGNTILQEMHNLDYKAPNFRERLEELRRLHQDTLAARRELRLNK